MGDFLAENQLLIIIFAKDIYPERFKKELICLTQVADSEVIINVILHQIPSTRRGRPEQVRLCRKLEQSPLRLEIAKL